MVDEEVVQEAGVARLHQREPGHGDRGEQRQPRQRHEAQDDGQPRPWQQPGADDERRG